MANRLYDSDKYKHQWYRELSPESKLIWDYLTTSCDHAGIWPEDYPQATFHLGFKVTRQKVAALEGRVIRIDSDKLFIPSFVRFQYKLGPAIQLNPANKAHLGVIRQLERFAIDPLTLQPASPLPFHSEAPTKPLPSPPSRGTGVGVEVGIGEEGGSGGKQTLDFDTLWKRYPKKVGKTEARDRFQRMIKTLPEYDQLHSALSRYLSHHAKLGTEPRFILNMATFLGTEKKQAWRDWLEADAGKMDAPTNRPTVAPYAPPREELPEHTPPPADIMKSHGAFFKKLGIGRESA